MPFEKQRYLTKITHPLFCRFFTGGDEYGKSVVLDAGYLMLIIWGEG